MSTLNILEANFTQEIGMFISPMDQKFMEEINAEKDNFGPVSTITEDSNGIITSLVHIEN